MLNIIELVVSPFMQNARILHCSKTNHSVLIDPGGDAPLILKALADSASELQAIWLTHSHLDHCGGVKKILNEKPVPLLGHKLEAFMRSHVENVSDMYGIPRGEFENCPEPEQFIDEGDRVSVGEYSFDVLFTPGHSPGHVSFYSAEEALIISGDVLFADSIGRTDLPGGDHNVLIRTIKDRLFTLPPETKVLCGHGDSTTIGREKKYNPFLNAA